MTRRGQTEKTQRKSIDESDVTPLARATGLMPWLQPLCADFEAAGWSCEAVFHEPNRVDAWLYWRPPLKHRQAYRISRPVLMAVSTEPFSAFMTAWIGSRSAQTNGEVDPRLVLVADGRPGLRARAAALPHWQGVVAVEPGAVGELDADLARVLKAIDPFDLRVPVEGEALVGRDDDLLQLVADLQEHPAIGLFGLRKMGKTSLAKAVQARFTALTDPGAPHTWAFAYADAEREQQGGVEGLAQALTAQLHRPRKGNEQPGRGLPGLRHAVEHLNRTHHPVCLIIDEHDLLIQGGNAYAAGAVDLLRLLRALSQDRAQALRVVLIGRQPDRVNAPWLLDQPNPTLNYFRPHWVGPLRREASDALLRQLGEAAGLHFDPPALDEAWELAAGHPLMTRLYGSAIYQQALAASDGAPLRAQAAGPFALAARNRLLRGTDAQNHFAEVQLLLTQLNPDALALLGELARSADPAALWSAADADEPQAADLLQHFGLVEPGTGRVPGLLRYFLAPRPARRRAAEVA
jgi:hypothetical protein